MADVTIIELIKEIDGCEKLGIEVDVRQANSWEGYDIYAISYGGGTIALGDMRFYRIVDGEPKYLPFQEVMQMAKSGYDPWRGKREQSH